MCVEGDFIPSWSKLYVYSMSISVSMTSMSFSGSKAIR